jgi:sulfate permease, SulP family
MGQLPSTLPHFFLPAIPLTLDTLLTIFPYAVTLAAVGLLESLMTAVIVDEMTDTPSAKNRECAGQGIANIVAGCFGGMAGCAMIGQSVINVKSGGRGRLSTLFAGALLLFLILVLEEWVKQIPMGALVAVMIMVAISTFNWKSLANMRHYPRSSSLVMVTTVMIVVFTHNLALGVFIGVLMSALFFARKVAHFFAVETSLSEDGKHKTYHVYGQIFFASADRFISQFDFQEIASRVTIDLPQAHFWDLTGVGALDKVVIKFRKMGAEVTLIGMNEASATIVDRLGVFDKPEAMELLHSH